VGSGYFAMSSLPLARLVERVTKTLGEKRLTRSVFLHVAKAFDKGSVYDLVYKLTVLNFPLIPGVKIISSYLRGRRPPSKQLLPLGVACGLTWRRVD
jgi:hypothetical protein